MTFKTKDILQEMIFALQQVQLDKDDEGVNIFVLDWAQVAQPPYNQAVVNIELLGIYVAKEVGSKYFNKTMKTQNFNQVFLTTFLKRK